MGNYFKNTELAAKYNISETTVRNWIKATKEGRLQLQLTERNGRFNVANSISNIALIEHLVGQNRKYRNTNAVKTVTPDPEFFEIFSESQVYDIIRNLELHHDIPRQYGYFREAANEWDEYIDRQMEAEVPSLARRGIELLTANQGYIDQRLAKFEKVNVIDIGVGNAVPVKQLLTHLRKQGKLGRYVALDFSKDMLDIAERRLRSWFGKAFPFEGYQLDIAHERFTNLLVHDYLRGGQGDVNLVLFLGGTPTNLRAPSDAFRTICESMNPADLLIYTDRVEAPEEPPEWLRHSHESVSKKLELLGRHKFVLERLGVKESFYTTKVEFDWNRRRKLALVELKLAINVKFNFKGGGQRVVKLEKGDIITVWYCWRMTHRELMSLLEDAGFFVVHCSTSEDRYVLAISELQRA